MDEEFDFDALNKEFEQGWKNQGSYDVKAQAEELLRGGVVGAINRIMNIVQHCENDALALKASMFVVDRVVGTKPVESDTTKALVERLQQND